MTTKKEIEEELMKTKKRIAELEDKHNDLVDHLQQEINTLRLEKEEGIPSYSAKVRDIQAPYVSYKITKVVGGRSPKIETTIKVSGAIEEIKTVDFEVMLNDVKEVVVKHINQPDEETQ